MLALVADETLNHFRMGLLYIYVVECVLLCPQHRACRPVSWDGNERRVGPICCREWAAAGPQTPGALLQDC
jgi:hypothetical protein